MPRLVVQSYKAWSPEFESEEKYSLVKINSAQGRKLSSLTKTTVDLGLLTSENHEIDHVIFSSRHGEIGNASELLTFIGKQEVLSPMIFSQSVHNAAVGTYALLKKTHVATTSLGAGRDSFMMGLFSCAAYLQEQPDHKILLLAGDQKVPDTFADHLSEKNIPFAAAFVISNSGPGITLDFEMQTSSKSQNSIPQPIEFLKWLSSDSSNTILNGDGFSWKLSKCSPS